MQPVNPHAVDLGTTTDLNYQMTAAQLPGQPMEPLIRQIEKYAQISLSDATLDSESFTVRVKLQGLLQEPKTLPILEPISIDHAGKVIARGRMVKHNGKFNLDDRAPGLKCTEVSGILSIENPALFQTFADTILRDEEVEVVLRTAIQSVPIERVLKFRGLNFFRTPVVLCDVVIKGSDEMGESVKATVNAIITNTSEIIIADAELTADVYYVPKAGPELKIGYVEKKGLKLQRGCNVWGFDWTFQPTNLDDGVRRFLLQYLLNTEQISILLRVTSIGVNICGHQYRLRPLDVKAAVQGIRKRLINRVDVSIGGSILTRTFSFVFEFENPIDSTLTVSDIDLKVYVYTKSGTPKRLICKVNHRFQDPNSFVIQAVRKQRSPKVYATLELDYIAALKLLGHRNVFVEVTSATVLVEKYNLPGLAFELPKVPFRWKISWSK